MTDFIIDMGTHYIKEGKRYKKIKGVGINDTNIMIIHFLSNGHTRKDKYYGTWVSMLERCFCNKFKTKHPTYKDVSCCKEWLYLSNFKSWMETQDWEGKQLDKDLLVYKNKIYSPETCVFVSGALNKFLTKNNSCRGNTPLGVKEEYLSRIGRNKLIHPYSANISIENKSIRLGSFKTTEEAHKCWQKEKIKQAIKIKNTLTDENVITGLQRVIDKIQHDLDNNLITEDF